MKLTSKAEVWQATCIKEAKANCAYTIAEAENCCSVAIRKVESHGTKQAHSIQQAHAEGMQHLETEAIREEGKDCLSFLATCGAALQASPPKPMGSGDPLSSDPGKFAPSTLLNVPPSVSLQESALPVTHPTAPMAPGPPALSKQQHPSPSQTVSPPQLEVTSRVTSKEPPHSKRRDEMPLHKALAGSWWEAFIRDLDLVQKAREEHYKTNCPYFNHETSCNLMKIFWDMIPSAGLLGSHIYEIQEFWEGWSEL